MQKTTSQPLLRRNEFKSGKYCSQKSNMSEFDVKLLSLIIFHGVKTSKDLFNDLRNKNR